MSSLSRVRVNSRNPRRVVAAIAVGVIFGLLASFFLAWWVIRRREVMVIDWGEFSTEEDREEDEEEEGQEERWSESEERTLRSSGGSWRRGMKTEVVSPRLVEVVLVSSRSEQESTATRRIGGGGRGRSRSGSRGVHDGRLRDSLSALQPLSLDFLPPKPETTTIHIPHPFSWGHIPFRLPSHHHNPQPKAGVLEASFLILLPQPPSPTTPATPPTHYAYPPSPAPIREIPEMEIGSIRLCSSERVGRRRRGTNDSTHRFGDSRPS